MSAIRGYLVERMDRPIVPGTYFISPGEYTACFSDGKVYTFDFAESEAVGGIDDPCMVVFFLRDVVVYDDDCESDDEMIEDFARHLLTDKIVDGNIFVFTGDGDDPEINVTEAIDFTLRVITADKDIEVPYPQEVIEKINNNM